MNTKVRVIGAALWLIGAVALLFWLASHARAQEKPVATMPLGVVSSNVSTTIAVTDTFQQVFAALTTQRGRTGCTIINYGAATMWVFEDSTAAGLVAANVSATATKAKSVQLATNQAYSCGTNGIVISSAIFITGTATQAFYGAQQ